jgi:hypothetical protein
MQVTYIIEFIIIGSNLYTREYQFNSEMGVIYWSTVKYLVIWIITVG